MVGLAPPERGRTAVEDRDLPRRAHVHVHRCDVPGDFGERLPEGVARADYWKKRLAVNLLFTRIASTLLLSHRNPGIRLKPVNFLAITRIFDVAVRSR